MEIVEIVEIVVDPALLMLEELEHWADVQALQGNSQKGCELPLLGLPPGLCD